MTKSAPHGAGQNALSEGKTALMDETMENVTTPVAGVVHYENARLVAVEIGPRGGVSAPVSAPLFARFHRPTPGALEALLSFTPARRPGEV